MRKLVGDTTFISLARVQDDCMKFQIKTEKENKMCNKMTDDVWYS